MKTPPISEQELQPKIISNIQYVDGIEEMEKIELKPNEIALRFDNNVSSFYIRSRDKHGEYSPIKIYFYEDFATKIQNIGNWALEEKCRELKYDALKTELAVKFFIENMKPMNVWLWLLETDKANWGYDYVRNLKSKMKKAIYGKVTN
jgi:hypothetical protein